LLEDLIEEHTVKVMLPSYDIIDVSYYSSRSYGATVMDLKNKIGEATGGMDPRRMRLLLRYEELEDSTSLTFLQNEYSCTLHLVYRMVDVHPDETQMDYNGFIRSITPAEGTVSVAVTESIILHVSPNQYGHVIRLNALVDSSLLPLKYDGDMLAQFQGNRRKAEDLGFKQWTNQTYLERILLLQVDDHLDLRLDSIRYNLYGINNGYMGGDMHSWQRYTTEHPVECKITVTDLHEEDGGGDEHSIITVKPYGPLKYSTHYALLLCNNVPTVPAGSIAAPWTAFTMGGVSEDKLFIFKTEKRP
jgi:hypothetical protein